MMPKTETIDVVPAKYHSKVMLGKVSTTLECQSWEKLCVPWFVRDLGFGIWDFYSSIELTSVS